MSAREKTGNPWAVACSEIEAKNESTTNVVVLDIDNTKRDRERAGSRGSEDGEGASISIKEQDSKWRRTRGRIWQGERGQGYALGERRTPAEMVTEGQCTSHHCPWTRLAKEVAFWREGAKAVPALLRE